MSIDGIHTGLSKLEVNQSQGDASTSAASAASEEVEAALTRPRRGQDITTIFNAASLALQPSQLVKDDYFTLFESVAALEIMDPKMDSGVTLPDEDSVVEQFDEMAHALPEEIIWIMDEMLCFEMVWHDGYPLSQTLFTSLHLNKLLGHDRSPLAKLQFQKDDSKPLVTSVFRAYCLGVAKCCDLVIREIMSEHFFEEEDFVTANFTRDLCTGVTGAELIECIEQAISKVQDINLSPALADAIELRLRMRLRLLEAFDAGDEHVDFSRAERFSEIRAMISDLRTSHALAVETAVPVFSERVQRYLASNTPPRPMQSLDFNLTIQRLQQTCDDVVAAFEMTTVEDIMPHALMRFTWQFSSRKPQPSTFSRAVMQGLLFKRAAVFDRKPHIDLLLADMQITSLGGSPILDTENWEVELPTSPRYQIARKVDEFMTRSLDEYLNLFRMIMQNRCRVRRTHAQTIAILDSVQAMAEQCDSDITTLAAQSAATQQLIPLHIDDSFGITSWIYYHKLHSMSIVVQMGFELDLYLPDELASSYTLLTFFETTRAEHIRAMIDTLRLRLQKLPRTNTNSAADLARADITRSARFLDTRLSEAVVLAALSSAISTLFGLLQGLLLIPGSPASRISSQQLRHELRLKPFLPCGTPQLPTWEELDPFRPEVTDRTVTALCETAEDELKLVKAEIARLKAATSGDAGVVGVEKVWAADLKAWLFAAIGVGVGVAGVKSACAAIGVQHLGELGVGSERAAEKRRLLGERLVVEIPPPDKRQHEWWVVPKVTTRR